eukprot:7777826-Pyramimonas_sp.AAC.1
MEIVEEYQPPANSEYEMATAPAFSDGYEPDSPDDDTRPTSEEEPQLSLRPQVMRSPRVQANKRRTRTTRTQASPRASLDSDYLANRTTGLLANRYQTTI